MTAAELDAIAARCEAATPGPWDGLNVVRRDRAALLAEVHRLRGLVEAAYKEGQGDDGVNYREQGWAKSDAFHALEGE